jgi:hypothetical protein
VYCIGERDAIAGLLRKKLPDAIEGGSLLMVTGGSLGAVVSPVPLADYAEDALPGRLSEATWTAIRAMRHQNVVQHFATRSGVVPLRFGTIYLKQGHIERMLLQREPELRSILNRLIGRDEWGINIYQDRRNSGDAFASSSATLRKMEKSAASASPGRAYLMKKKIDAVRVHETRAETSRVLAEIERELKSFSEGARRLRILKNEPDEYGVLTARFAFLVSRERFAQFRAVAARLAKKHARSGVQFELTGPWPAFNFASD